MEVAQARLKTDFNSPFRTIVDHSIDVRVLMVVRVINVLQRTSEEVSDQGNYMKKRLGCDRIKCTWKVSKKSPRPFQ